MVLVRQCSAAKIDIFRAVLDAFKLKSDGREAIQIDNFWPWKLRDGRKLWIAASPSLLAMTGPLQNSVYVRQGVCLIYEPSS